MTLKWHFCDRISSVHLSAVLDLIQGLEPVENGLLQVNAANVKANIVIAAGQYIKAVTVDNGAEQLTGRVALTRLLSIGEGQFFYKEASASDLAEIKQDVEIPLSEVMDQVRSGKQAAEAPIRKQEEEERPPRPEAYCGDNWLAEELEAYCGDNWLTERPTSAEDIYSVIESSQMAEAVSQQIPPKPEAVDLAQPVTTAKADGHKPEAVDLAQPATTDKVDGHETELPSKLSAAGIIKSLASLEQAAQCESRQVTTPGPQPEVSEVVDLAQTVKKAIARGHGPESSSKLTAAEIIKSLALLEQAGNVRTSGRF